MLDFPNKSLETLPKTTFINILSGKLHILMIYNKSILLNEELNFDSALIYSLVIGHIFNYFTIIELELKFNKTKYNPRLWGI